MPSSAPSKDVSRDLKAKLKRAEKKPMGFFYCAGGEEGDPVLIIDKQVKSAASKIKKTATIKQFAMGTTQYGHGSTPCFVLDTAKPPKFERHLQTFFGKGVPALKKADIYTRKEWDEDSKPVTEDELPDFDDTEEKSDRGDAEAKLSEAAEGLPWRASQTLKHSKKFVRLSGQYGIDGDKKVGSRMAKQLEVLDKWAGRVLESAEAFAEAVESGAAQKDGAKAAIKDLAASRKMVWEAHKSITHDHSSGYPSKAIKKAASAARSKIKKAHIALKKI